MKLDKIYIAQQCTPMIRAVQIQQWFTTFYEVYLIFAQMDDTDDTFAQPLREYVLYTDCIKVSCEKLCKLWTIQSTPQIFNK